MCKRNQAIAIARLKAKRARRKHGVLLSTFDVLGLLPHFHSMKKPLLALGYPMEFVRPPQLPPWLFYSGPPSHPQQLAPISSDTATKVVERPPNCSVVPITSHDAGGGQNMQ